MRSLETEMTTQVPAHTQEETITLFKRQEGQGIGLEGSWEPFSGHRLDISFLSRIREGEEVWLGQWLRATGRTSGSQ